MANKYEVEARRRKIRDLMKKGNTQKDISEKLHVSEQTISKDVQVINAKYSKLVSNNESYLAKTTERMFEWLEKYDFIIKQFYDLKEGTVERANVESIIDRFLPELVEEEYSEEEPFKSASTKRNSSRDALRRDLNSIARANVQNQTAILREIRTTLSEQAKVLQLVTGSKTYIQKNTLNITFENLKEVFDRMKEIIYEYVPKIDRVMALQDLKKISFDDPTKPKGGEGEQGTIEIIPN